MKTSRVPKPAWAHRVRVERGCKLVISVPPLNKGPRGDELRSPSDLPGLFEHGDFIALSTQTLPTETLIGTAELWLMRSKSCRVHIAWGQLVDQLTLFF